MAAKTTKEVMAGASLLTDLDLIILGATRGAHEICGCEATELIGRDARKLFSLDTPLGSPAFDGNPGVPSGMEGEAVRSDGARIPLRITADRIDTPAGGQILLSVQCVHPIQSTSERKQTEEQLQLQSILLDQSEEALIVRDLEDRICFWSKGAERLYGWPAGEAVGRNIYDLLFPLQLQALDRQAHDMGETGEWTGELRQITRTRKNVIVESHWKVHRSEDGQPLYVAIVNRDITEKKALEGEILRAQRMECIGALAGAIAHDLNNVLPAVLISIRGLRQEHDNLEDREALESSLFRAEHAAKLITRLLSLASEIDEEPTAIDVVHAIGETAKIIKSAFPKSIEIRTLIAEDLPDIAGNPTHFYQVLLNLCLNARDAMASGGTLTIEAGNQVIHEAGAETGNGTGQVKPGEYVLVKVSDTGTGIPAENAGRIFEPSFTTKDRDKGSGLGLFSVARIVQNHNGFISLSSEPKRGTQFFVYIPARKPETDRRARSR